MANVLSKGSLFPAELTNEMFNLVKGKSSLAKLSGPLLLMELNFSHSILIRKSIS